MAICHQNIKKGIKDHNIDSDLIFCYFRIFRQNVGQILTHYLVKWKLVHSICWLIDCSRRRSAVPSKLETTVLSLGSLSTSRSFCVFKQTSKQTNKKKTTKITQKSINHCVVLLISLIAHFIKLFWCLGLPCPLSWWKVFMVLGLGSKGKVLSIWVLSGPPWAPWHIRQHLWPNSMMFRGLGLRSKGKVLSIEYWVGPPRPPDISVSTSDPTQWCLGSKGTVLIEYWVLSGPT